MQWLVTLTVGAFIGGLLIAPGQQPERSVADLVVTTADGQQRHACCFAVDGGFIVSTLGAIRDAKSAELNAPGNRQLPVAGVVAYNRLANIALLEVDWKGQPPLPPVLLDSSAPVKGTKVHFPLSEGKSVEVPVLDQADVVGFSFSSDIKPDASLGGHLLVSDERVVGVVTGYTISLGTAQQSPEGRASGPHFTATRCELIRALTPGKVVTWEDWPQQVKAMELSHAALEDSDSEERVAAIRAKDSKKLEALLARAARKAVELDSANWQAWQDLAGTLFYEGRQDEALAAAETAVQLAPTADVSIYICARVSAELGRSAQALAYAKNLISLRPTGENCHLAMGLALCSNGDYAGAMDAFREELRLHPENAKAKEAIEKFEELKKQGAKPRLEP
jgi:cytochrome c-type biogenesis protein CcmH/NrfG